MRLGAPVLRYGAVRVAQYWRESRKRRQAGGAIAAFARCDAHLPAEQQVLVHDVRQARLELLERALQYTREAGGGCGCTLDVLSFVTLQCSALHCITVCVNDRK